MPTMPIAGLAEFDLEEVVKAVERLEQKADTRIRMALQQVAGEVATEAKTNHDYKDRTGKLTASIRAGEVKGTFGTGFKVDMLAGGRGGAGTVTYASHVEFGTKAHPIKARKKKALAFFFGASKILGGGGAETVVRSVKHPGTRAYKFMQNALVAKTPRAEKLLDIAMELAIDEAGLT